MFIISSVLKSSPSIHPQAQNCKDTKSVCFKAFSHMCHVTGPASFRHRSQACRAAPAHTVKGLENVPGEASHLQLCEKLDKQML